MRNKSDNNFVIVVTVVLVPVVHVVALVVLNESGEVYASPFFCVFYTNLQVHYG